MVQQTIRTAEFTTREKTGPDRLANPGDAFFVPRNSCKLMSCSVCCAVDPNHQSCARPRGRAKAGISIALVILLSFNRARMTQSDLFLPGKGGTQPCPTSVQGLLAWRPCKDRQGSSATLSEAQFKGTELKRTLPVRLTCVSSPVCTSCGASRPRPDIEYLNFD